jgi:hypothetical protein
MEDARSVEEAESRAVRIRNATTGWKGAIQLQAHAKLFAVRKDYRAAKGIGAIQKSRVWFALKIYANFVAAHYNPVALTTGAAKD